MRKIAPSILAADFSRLGEQLNELESAGADIVHIDVMDGQFVPNISIGFPVISSIRPSTKMTFDVHLMVNDPERYVKTAADSGADIITVHAEACPHLHHTLSAIRALGLKAGAALSPATSLDDLRYVLDELDLILIMTVNPGFGGQPFIPAMTEKIKACREMISALSAPPLIELDGGITKENAALCFKAGADILVSGSGVFKGNISENFKALNNFP